MKTIEEAATNAYSIEVLSSGCNAGVTFGKEMFKQGVEYAQKWIPVEEELPPKEKDTDESEIVLIRETQDFGNFFLGWYDYHQKAWFMVYRLHQVKPTHWRPVHFL